MQDNKGWNNNLLKWASSFISGDSSSKKKDEKISVRLSYVSSLSLLACMLLQTVYEKAIPSFTWCKISCFSF
jgi:hypothetical protein